MGDPNFAGNISRIIKVDTDFGLGMSYEKTTLPAYTNKLILFLRIMNMTSTQGNLNQMKLYDAEYVDSLRLSLTIFKPLGVSFRILAFNTIYVSIATDFWWNPDIFWGGTITLPATGGSFITGNTWSFSFMITGLAFM